MSSEQTSLSLRDRAIGAAPAGARRSPVRTCAGIWFAAALVLGSGTGCTQEVSGSESDDSLATLRGLPAHPAHNGTAGSKAPPVKTGKIHALWTLNHEPMLDDVAFSDSKFVCGPSAEICATAHDEDGDPLDLSLLPAGDCSVTERVAEVITPSEGAPATVRQCWTLACHVAGQIDLKVQVHDLVQEKGKLVPIEELIEATGSTSHGELAFFAYFEGTPRWPDGDKDGQGAKKARATIFCSGDPTPGWVDNHDDCDDADKTTYLGAPEVCGDKKDNNCSGLCDEKCIVRPKVRHR